MHGLRQEDYDALRTLPESGNEGALPVLLEMPDSGTVLIPSYSRLRLTDAPSDLAGAQARLRRRVAPVRLAFSFREGKGADLRELGGRASDAWLFKSRSSWRVLHQRLESG
jgi:hypothetical protein